MSRTLGASGLLGLVLVACSGSSGGGSAPGNAGGASGAASLAGTWDVVTTPMGGTGSVSTTVVVGQDSLTVTSPSFSLTAVRAGDVSTFTDHDNPSQPGNDVVLAATQTAARFDAGILPFDLGGTWTMQIVPAGQGAVMSCTLSVSATEIDGACQKLSSDGFDFAFTTKKLTSAASVLGDFGGTWMSTWMESGMSLPCELDFAGNGITTCAAGGASANAARSPLAGITFTYDGANQASGAAQGWAEYSATRE